MLFVLQMSSDVVKEILFSLYRNARKTYTKIGEEVGRDRSNVKKIVDRMEDEKIIWNYCPVVDVRKLGAKTFIALFKYGAKSTHSVIIKSMRDEIRKNEGLDDSIIFVDSALCHGEFDYFATLVTKDVIVIKKLVDRIKATYPDFIGKVSILEVILPVRICGNINPELEADIVRVLK